MGEKSKRNSERPVVALTLDVLRADLPRLSLAIFSCHVNVSTLPVRRVSQRAFLKQKAVYAFAHERQTHAARSAAPQCLNRGSRSFDVICSLLKRNTGAEQNESAQCSGWPGWNSVFLPE